MRGGRILTWTIALSVLGTGAGHTEKQADLLAAVQNVPLSAAQERALAPKDSFKECDNLAPKCQ
jgi:hypothetical protein